MDTHRWTQTAIAFVVVLVGMGIALAVVLATRDAGPGPQGDVGPEGDVGPDTQSVLEGSGVVITQTRQVGRFDQLVLTGVADVIVTTDGFSDLEIEADDNIVALIETSVENGTLLIALEHADLSLRPSSGIVVRVGTDTLTQITHGGVGSVTVGRLDSDQLDIAFTGVGGVAVDLSAERLAVDASGVGGVTVTGTVVEPNVTLDDMADYVADTLQSEPASVTHSGNGEALLWVTRNLDVVIRDLGSVSYYGTPEVTSDIPGRGTLIPLGER